MWKPEYFVRLVSLPAGIEGAVLPNDDGTFDIYINSALPKSRREDVLRHELLHLNENHFYRDELSVGQAEACASGLVGIPSVTVIASDNKRKRLPANSEGFIRHFNSLEDLLQFALQNGGL